MKPLTFICLLCAALPAFAQAIPYQGFSCQIYDRLCSDPTQDFCYGYEGKGTVDGGFPTSFTLIWTPPSLGCLATYSFCSAQPADPAVGEVWFYYTRATNPQGDLPECGPVPPPPLSDEACAYMSSEVDYHGH